jgi:hypothetical protein
MEDFDPFLLGRTVLGVRFGNAFLENLNVKTGGSTAQGIGRVMEYRRKRLRPRKKNSRTFDAGEAKENKLGLILPKLGFAPEPLGSRYVYRPKVLAPNPQSQYMQVRDPTWPATTPCHETAFGSSSYPQGRLGKRNVLGFRTIPAPERAENTKHALGLSYCSMMNE